MVAAGCRLALELVALDRICHEDRQMIRPGVHLRSLLAVIIAGVSWSSALGEGAGGPASPFQEHVDMQTFMEHVLMPAATVIWRSNGVILDARGEHDLSPKSDADWEQMVSGAATLAEATNALMIPQRVRDQEWIGHVRKLSDAANKAYRAAEEHDLKGISEVSDQLDGICEACHRHYGLQ
jgi:hypothetical protein